MSRYRAVGHHVFWGQSMVVAEARNIADAALIARALNALEGVPDWLDERAKMYADFYGDGHGAQILNDAAADIRAGKWEKGDD